MGLHLHCCLLGRVYQEGGEHPTWDWLRYDGDREFWDFLCDTEGMLDSTLGSDGECYHRPADIARAKAWVLATFPEKHFPQIRLLHLLGILDLEPTYWLYASM